jgi:hypothetical protein
MSEKKYIWAHYPTATKYYFAAAVYIALLVLFLALIAGEFSEDGALYWISGVVIAGLAILFPKYIRTV